MGRRVRVRGIVNGGASFAQSRRPDGEGDLWRVGVGLRPWRVEGGPIQTSTVGFRRNTRLPFWLWRLLFIKNTTVELLAEVDDDVAKGGRLIAWLGPRRDQALREAQRGWRGERRLEHSAFGRFTFDERLDWFETKRDWLGQPVSVALGMATDGSTAVEDAARVFDQAAEWDTRARNLAAKDLLTTANEWRDDSEPPLTADDFRRRMTLESVTVHLGPYIQFYFNDGGLFAGHTIIATFDEEEGESWAEFAG